MIRNVRAVSVYLHNASNHYRSFAYTQTSETPSENSLCCEANYMIHIRMRQQRVVSLAERDNRMVMTVMAIATAIATITSHTQQYTPNTNIIQ